MNENKRNSKIKNRWSWKSVAKTINVLGVSGVALLGGCANPPPTIAGAVDQWNHWDVLVVGSTLFETWKARQMPSWNIQVRRIMEDSQKQMEVIELQATENPWVMYHANAGMQTLKEGSRKWCAQFYEKEELRTFEEGWTPMIFGGSYWARGRVVCSQWNDLKKDWEAQKIKQPYPINDHDAKEGKINPLKNKSEGGMEEKKIDKENKKPVENADAPSIDIRPMTPIKKITWKS